MSTLLRSSISCPGNDDLHGQVILIRSTSDLYEPLLSAPPPCRRGRCAPHGANDERRSPTDGQDLDLLSGVDHERLGRQRHGRVGRQGGDDHVREREKASVERDEGERRLVRLPLLQG